jgi:sec-independent protein translocase protein TatA
MGGFSPLHWLVIGGVALLLFGNRLPEVARSIGRAIQEFKKGLKDVQDEVKQDDDYQPPRHRFNEPQPQQRIDASESEEPKHHAPPAEHETAGREAEKDDAPVER